MDEPTDADSTGAQFRRRSEIVQGEVLDRVVALEEWRPAVDARLEDLRRGQQQAAGERGEVKAIAQMTDAKVEKISSSLEKLTGNVLGLTTSLNGIVTRGASRKMFWIGVAKSALGSVGAGIGLLILALLFGWHLGPLTK